MLVSFRVFRPARGKFHHVGTVHPTQIPDPTHHALPSPCSPLPMWPIRKEGRRGGKAAAAGREGDKGGSRPTKPGNATAVAALLPIHKSSKSCIFKFKCYLGLLKTGFVVPNRHLNKTHSIGYNDQMYPAFAQDSGPLCRPGQQPSGGE